MRQGREHEGRVPKRRIFRRHEGDAATRELKALATLRVRRGEGEREVRMLRHECAEFASGVTGCA
jgi:hypothetical protein